MAENKALLSGGGGAVCSGDNLSIRAADSERDRAHEHPAGARIRLGDIIQPKRVWCSWQDGECTHEPGTTQKSCDPPRTGVAARVTRLSELLREPFGLGALIGNGRVIGDGTIHRIADIAHPPLELTDSLADRTTNFRYALPAKKNQTDQQQHQQFFGAKLEHDLLRAVTSENCATRMAWVKQ